MGIVSTCPRCGADTYDYACPGCDAETIASLKDDIAVLQQELSLTRTEVIAQTRAKEELVREVERLKAGKFSQEELDQLCMAFPPEKVCAFRRGCAGYQVQLFGKEQVQADLTRELHWALKQVAYRDGGERLAELLAEMILSDERPSGK